MSGQIYPQLVRSGLTVTAHEGGYIGLDRTEELFLVSLNKGHWDEKNIREQGIVRVPEISEVKSRYCFTSRASLQF